MHKNVKHAERPAAHNRAKEVRNPETLEGEVASFDPTKSDSDNPVAKDAEEECLDLKEELLEEELEGAE